MDRENIEKPFQGMDALIAHLKNLTLPTSNLQAKDPQLSSKKIPIVLVHGLFEWATAESQFYHVFGPCLDLADLLAAQGWPVIVPNLGPLSSTWERACELYASLTHESRDGKSFDILVDYGTPSVDIDDPLILDPEAPNRKRQARAFNLDPNWRWGPENPVHFVAHGHGANTCRYLIYLLEQGKSLEGSWYFTEEKRGWVRSLTTLGAPCNGTTLPSLLGGLERTELLLNRLIASSSYMQQSSRLYDFALDHRGIHPPTTTANPSNQEDESPEMDLGTYLAKLMAPDGALTKWKSSRYNAFHDNSITGVVGGLNKIIGSPSKDVYYFSLSFVGTEDVLDASSAVRMTDVWGMLASEMETTGGGWGRSPIDNLVSSMISMPKLLLGYGDSKEASIDYYGTRAVGNVNGIINYAGSTLQDVALWALTHVNPHIPSVIPKPTVKTTRPRIDIWSPLMLWAFQMCSYILSPSERKVVANVQGPTNCRAWQKHDGLVPTCSQRGPWGYGNKTITVQDVLNTLPWGWGLRRREGISDAIFELPRGVWIDLGEHSGLDHMECMGLFVGPRANEEVKHLYSRIMDLLEVLPSA